MENFYSENLKVLLWVLGNDFRLKIVNILAKNHSGMTGAGLAREMDNIDSAILQRPIDQLFEREITCRNNKRLWILSGYGRKISEQLSPLKFLADNKEFFKSHDYGDMPFKFSRHIGDLSNSQYITDEFEIHDIWIEMYANAKEYIYNILASPEYTDDLLEPLSNLLKKGGHSKTIFRTDFKGGKKRLDIRRKYHIPKYELDGKVERKMQDIVVITVVLTEREAFIMFPFSNGKIDRTEIFHSKDPIFCEFCLDYFNFCWDHAKKFKEYS